MTDMNRFSILKTAGSARLGVYNAKTSTIHTPNFLCSTSRGVVPHLTPDNVARIGHGGGMFVAAEDFMDKIGSKVPLLSSELDIRQLMALPDEAMVMSTRRSTPLPVQQPNTDDSVSIYTSEGLKKMPVDTYHQFVQAMKPDIVLAASDIPNPSPSGVPGNNRARKMVVRTERWLQKALEKHGDQSNMPTESTLSPDIFATILPGVATFTQQDYLDYLGQQRENIQGLSFWTKMDIASDNPKKLIEPALELVKKLGMDHLPRFLAVDCDSPQEMLRLIEQGYDLFQGDMATQFTNVGVALDMSFPAVEGSVWGRDMWQKEANEVNMEPLSSNVKSSIGYYRAYIHHLLKAKEMSAWVFLQMHNLGVIDGLFKGIRDAISNGTFEEEVNRFEQIYGTADELKARLIDLSEKNVGPTSRGYNNSNGKAKDSYRKL